MTENLRRVSRYAFLTFAVYSLAAPLLLPAQSSGQFVSLFDGTFNGWTIENNDNGSFTIEDGILRIEGSEGWLRSSAQYSDFLLRAEFRFITDNADSGIYVRAVADSDFVRGWPNNSYQIQMRNPVGESRFGPVGDLFRHGTPPGDFDFDPAVSARTSTGTGQWQTIEIEAEGDSLTVSLNGTVLSRAGNIVNPAGYIGIQSELGTIEFRSLDITER